MDNLREELKQNNSQKKIRKNIEISEEQEKFKSKYESQNSTQKLNYLLKFLQDFSNRYDLDSKNILSYKKFLLTFNDIISLIKEAIEYQNKIVELDNSEKEKIREISQDYINNLSYTIFSYDKIDILKNESKKKNKFDKKKKYGNQILYNNKFNKSKYSINSYNLTNNNFEEINNKKEIETHFSFNNEKKIIINNNESKKGKNIFEKETKLFSPNNKSLRYKKNNIIKKDFIENQNYLTSSIKTKKIDSNNLLGENIKLRKEKSNNDKIYNNKRKKSFNTKIYENSNIKTYNKNHNKDTRIQKQQENSTKKEINYFNSQIDYSLKNKSAILRSGSLKNNKENDLDILNAYNFYSTYNDLEKKLSDNQLVKEGYIIKGKINIFSNVPKPSVLANKLLESSKKYIKYYNGVNEQERKKNNFINHSHSLSNKKEKKI